MPRAMVADPSERLPWLSDPAFPKPRQPRRSWLPLAVAILVAGAIALAGWSLVKTAGETESAPPRPAESVALPPPSIVAQPQTEPQPVSPGERDALRLSPDTVPSSAAPAARTISKPAHAASSRKPASVASSSAKSAAPAYDPKAWNSGVRGRIIQVGAFPSAANAQAEWRRLYYRYPLLRPLSPRVIKTKRGGRTWYRLQLGTFSQAHSELLCQRLRATGEGCIVLGMAKRGRA